jgi:hypothetical protein
VRRRPFRHDSLVGPALGVHEMVRRRGGGAQPVRRGRRSAAACVRGCCDGARGCDVRLARSCCTLPRLGLLRPYPAAPGRGLRAHSTWNTRANSVAMRGCS